MIFRALSIFSVIVITLCVAQKLDLPNSVPTCKRDSNDYNSCLKQAIEEAWPLFVKGLPAEYDFPPLDPYNYGYQKVVLDTGNIHAEVILSNLTIEGMKATRFETVKAHFNNGTFRLEIDTKAPKILGYGNCVAHGDLAGIKVGGQGQLYIIIEDIRGTWHVSGLVKNDTWVIKHFRTTPMIKKLNIKMDNFFGGNQEINEFAVKFVNENWPPFYRSLLPILSKHWNKNFTDLLNSLFSNLSFSKVFP